MHRVSRLADFGGCDRFAAFVFGPSPTHFAAHLAGGSINEPTAWPTVGEAGPVRLVKWGGHHNTRREQRGPAEA